LDGLRAGAPQGSGRTYSDKQRLGHGRVSNATSLRLSLLLRDEAGKATTLLSMAGQGDPPENRADRECLLLAQNWCRFSSS
ncbi:MAG: hypothetical protein M3463_04440, partial [Verrucomicrobiota bacterium]|nr:hypothetical protein [Verrucomicrobiota bacterium]